MDMHFSKVPLVSVLQTLRFYCNFYVYMEKTMAGYFR